MAISNEIEKLERRWQQTSGLVFAPLAEAYRKAGLHQRALEVLEQGLALHPDYGPALIVRGRCHLDSSNLDQAEAAFEQALTRDPMDPIAIRGIADVFARTNRLTEAVERLQLLVDLDPRNAEARSALDRLQQYVIPDSSTVASAADPAPRPDEAPASAAPTSEVPPEPEASPVPAAPPLEALSLEPMEIPPAEPAPLLIQPTSLTPEPAVAPPAATEPAEFRIESFAVEPLEVPAELRSSPAPEPFEPISWTPAAQDEIVEAVSPDSEPPPDPGVVFTPAEASGEVPESRPSEAVVPEPLVESVPEELGEASITDAEGWSAESIQSEAVPESPPSVPWEEPAYEATSLVPSEPVAPEATDDVPPVRDEQPWSVAAPEAESEAVADGTIAEYASDMPPSDEPVPFLDEAIAPGTEPGSSAAEVVPDLEAELPEPAEAASSDPESREPSAEPAPVLIVTESMAELFLKQGHRELALAVYRQLSIRGPVSERLVDEMQRIEAELSARSTSSEAKPTYSAGQTGGRSVEHLLQAILRAQPPATASSVLPPAIEPAAEPTRAASDSLPLSAVFGDEPVVAPRPESVASEPEPSFDEFFGAVPAPEPATASGGEHKAEAEDLRQFNEWLKGLKR